MKNVRARGRSSGIPPKLLARMLVTEPSVGELLPALFANVTARFSGQDELRGSFLVNAAVERAPHDPAVQQAIAQHFERFDALLTAYFSHMQELGRLAHRFEPQLYAQSLISNLFSIGVLSRLNLGLQARENIALVAMALYE